MGYGVCGVRYGGQGTERRAKKKSQRDDSMLDERTPPLLFRAKEGHRLAESKISRGNLGLAM
jgi:hypothetical protein